jgi:SNF2 family DNA or RNA helicase
VAKYAQIYSPTCSGSSAKRRMILSGTPIQNDLDELYAMVSFVRPKSLGSVNNFQVKYSVPISRANEALATEAEKERGKEATDALKLLLNDLVLRRTQADILSKFLPPKYEFIIHCRLTGGQLLQYRRIAQETFRYVND